MRLLLSALLTVFHQGSVVILDQIEMRFESSTIWSFTASQARTQDRVSATTGFVTFTNNYK